MAGLVGITLTFVVYLTVLLPLITVTGAGRVTDRSLHIVAPLLTFGGWFLFGPRPRLDIQTLCWFLIWPGPSFAFSFVNGALTNWYPYPFVDVTQIGGTPERCSTWQS